MIKLRAHAKINLYLDVVGVLPGGYHAVESVMQSISLADELLIEPAEESSIICHSHPELEREDNLALRVLRAFAKTVGKVPGVRVEIVKNIPLAAGLAGGSADAAAVLFAINEMAGAPLWPEELASIASELGADIPFCLAGGTMLAEGKGERLSALPPPPEIEFVLVKSPFELSTADVYGEVDRLDLTPLGGLETMIMALREGSLESLASALGNRLQAASISLVPEIEGVLAALSSLGALGASVSGSGPTVFGLFRPGDGERAAESLRLAFKEAFVAISLPHSRGVEIVD